MSFILDALRKSETERQQQSSAEFTSVPTSSGASSVPRWVWVAGFLLAINLVILTALLLRPASVLLRPAVLSNEETPNMPEQESHSVPSFAERVAAAQLSPPQQQENETLTRPEETHLGIVRPILISQNPTAIPAADIYPSIYEVRASGLSNLPELHLDIHVYSPKAKDRFAFINMVKLHEGSRLQEGPVVAEITPEGVILEHQGQRFLLPRD